MRILLVGSCSETFAEMASALEKRSNISLSRADSGAAALVQAAAPGQPELVVVDETLADMTGLDFARKLVALNPMIYCAVVSALPGTDFHEASEGLGLLAQLPAHPVAADAQGLFGRIEKISRLATPKLY